MQKNQFIAIEGGGTKFVCAYGTTEQLSDRTVIKTQSPHSTLQEIVNYIRAAQNKAHITAIGLAVFGPLDLDPFSPTYGHITATPKPGWQNFNIVGALEQTFDLPVGFNTDVNGAALGEFHFGAARGLSDFLYLTVGTGIGGGVMLNKKLLHSAMHPEMGHIFIPHNFQQDSFEGVCSYHRNCFEGLASGPAMTARWQVNSILDLPSDHPAWDLEAHYLGLGIANYILTLAPQRVIVGGGVMQHTNLLPKIRAAVVKQLNGYVKSEKIIERMDEYIAKPELGENSGIYGAVMLAEESFKSSMKNLNNEELVVA